MGALVNIEKPKAGDDALKLWQTVADIIDALNNLSITIVPGGAQAIVTEGDFQLDLSDFITQEDAANNIPGYSPSGGSDQDNSGTPIGGGITDSGDGSEGD